VATRRGASFHLKDRNAFIGWTFEQCRRRRALLTNNSRLLILPGCAIAWTSRWEKICAGCGRSTRRSNRRFAMVSEPIRCLIQQLRFILNASGLIPPSHLRQYFLPCLPTHAFVPSGQGVTVTFGAFRNFEIPSFFCCIGVAGVIHSHRFHNLG
jgi:hypothetical protein